VNFGAEIDRRALAFNASCIVAFVLPIAACLGLNLLSWALFLLQLPELLVLALWLAAALGWGAGISKVFRYHGRFSWLLGNVISVAVGLGAMSLMTLLLGLWLPIHALAAWFVLGLGWIAGMWARDVWGCDMRTLTGGKARQPWLSLLFAAVAGLAVICAFLPPGVLWHDEPNGYDVVEYHLQVPREWYELGRILPLYHNVFSFFPFNVEMHYLLAMGLRGGPWAGMYLAQLMHGAFIALTVLAIYALVAERSKPVALIAAIAAAATPWLILLAPVAYDEGGLLLWGTLALGLCIRTEADQRVPLVAGALAGFACGAKLTAVPIVLLATPIICLILSRHREIKPALAYILAGLICFSPWLVRDLAWTGNPVFPEATAWFGQAHWSQTQVERWRRAHSPRLDQENLLARTATGWDQIVADWRFGYVLLPLGLVSAFVAADLRRTRMLLLLLGFLAVFWIFFTHLQGRFFVLAIPISALLIGQVELKRAGLVIYGALVAIMALGTLIGAYAKLTSLSPELFRLVGFESLQQLNTPLTDPVPEGTRVLLVGDARPFVYAVPTSRLFYRTVFDVDAEPGQRSDEAWQNGWPRGGPEITVVDAPELRRFARTYWGIPQPSEQLQQADGPQVIK
jgi:hypothetical protein